jgi:hypothetical protein
MFISSKFINLFNNLHAFTSYCWDDGCEKRVTRHIRKKFWLKNVGGRDHVGNLAAYDRMSTKLVSEK